MTEHRPFPPSPRRRALARRAGVHAASPIVVGGVACAAVLVAAWGLAAASSARLGRWIETASRGDATLAPGMLAHAVLELALPVIGAAAIAAVIAHLAQTRAVWLPRRALAGAPAPDRGAGARVRSAAFELLAAVTIGALVLGWLWFVAPRLARLPSIATLPTSTFSASTFSAPTFSALLVGATSLVASALAAVAIAWVTIGIGDALLRHREVAGALQMSAQDKREDDRLAGADPRWRSYRGRLARGGTDLATAVAGSTVLVLGDDVAVAIAWHAVRRPVPVRTAAGHGARATQLLGLARRHRIAAHRDPVLAAALARDHAGDGPIAERHWPRLAEIVAALRRS